MAPLKTVNYVFLCLTQFICCTVCVLLSVTQLTNRLTRDKAYVRLNKMSNDCKTEDDIVHKRERSKSSQVMNGIHIYMYTFLTSALHTGNVPVG